MRRSVSASENGPANFRQTRKTLSGYSFTRIPYECDDTWAATVAPCNENDDDLCFYRNFNPLLNLYRICGFFPVFPCEPESWRNLFKQIFIWSFSLACLGFNIGLFLFNVHIIHSAKINLGMLHVGTMTAILTGLKPFQNAVNLWIFIFARRKHLELLRHMNDVCCGFRDDFGVMPNWRCGRIGLFAASILLFLFCFGLRLAQYLLGREHEHWHWFLNASVLFVPCLSIWQFAPLFYFDYVTRLHAFWFRQLHRKMKRDIHLADHDLGFYYRHFIKLTRCLTAMGHFLNPFIFFSLVTSVAILCLTIYFITNAEVALSLPENVTSIDVVANYFLPVWAGLQILAAFVYIICITIAGVRVNEKSRAILSTVLAMVPLDEKSRFEVVCFVNKIQTQYMWGATVWRAFPIERSLLFTIFGITSTYAVVLLKLRSSQEVVISNDCL